MTGSDDRSRDADEVGPQPVADILNPEYDPPGSAPGAIALAVSSGGDCELRVMDFNAAELRDERAPGLQRLAELRTGSNVTWLHVRGEPSAELLQHLIDEFGLHPLAIEDAVQAGQRVKVDEYDGQLFLLLYWPRVEDDELRLVQTALFLGRNWVISFCRGPDDPFEPIRRRLRAEPPARIRQRGADYLFYALADVIVDHGFPVMDEIDERLDRIEDDILNDPDQAVLAELHVIRQQLVALRKALWPQRESLASLTREDDGLIESTTRPYLRDCYDHAVQLLELLESQREMAASLHDLYLSCLSNRMNDIMKVLTIIATLFIPLSFLTGLWGMNFDPDASPWNMPELRWYFGYPVALLLMLVVAIGMLVFFRRKRWL